MEFGHLTTSDFLSRCLFLLLTGSPRVEGVEEEDDVDDLEYKFNYL